MIFYFIISSTINTLDQLLTHSDCFVNKAKTDADIHNSPLYGWNLWYTNDFFNWIVLQLGIIPSKQGGWEDEVTKKEGGEFRIEL